jgi:hypothetical protein
VESVHGRCSFDGKGGVHPGGILLLQCEKDVTSSKPFKRWEEGKNAIYLVHRDIGYQAKLKADGGVWLFPRIHVTFMMDADSHIPSGLS